MLLDCRALCRTFRNQVNRFVDNVVWSSLWRIYMMIRPICPPDLSTWWQLGINLIKSQPNISIKGGSRLYIRVFSVLLWKDGVFYNKPPGHTVNSHPWLCYLHIYFPSSALKLCFSLLKKTTHTQKNRFIDLFCRPDEQFSFTSHVCYILYGFDL